MRLCRQFINFQDGSNALWQNHEKMDTFQQRRLLINFVFQIWTEIEN